MRPRHGIKSLRPVAQRRRNYKIETESERVFLGRVYLGNKLVLSLA